MSLPWPGLTPKKYRAYCKSEYCTPRHNTSAKGVEKDVPQSATVCPDCKRTLFWRPVGKELRNVAEYSHVKQARSFGITL